jgi:hypothetical protein
MMSAFSLNSSIDTTSIKQPQDASFFSNLGAFKSQTPVSEQSSAFSPGVGLGQLYSGFQPQSSLMGASTQIQRPPSTVNDNKLPTQSSLPF